MKPFSPIKQSAQSSTWSRAATSDSAQGTGTERRQEADGHGTGGRQGRGVKLLVVIWTNCKKKRWFCFNPTLKRRRVWFKLLFKPKGVGLNPLSSRSGFGLNHVRFRSSFFRLLGNPPWDQKGFVWITRGGWCKSFFFVCPRPPPLDRAECRSFCFRHPPQFSFFPLPPHNRSWEVGVFSRNCGPL